MYKFCSKICFQYKGWHSLSFINWNLSKTQHDADWLGIITKLICSNCPKHKYLLCIVTIRAFPPKHLGGQHQNCKKIGKIKDIVETVRYPFWALDIWTLGLIKDWWQTHEVLPHQDIIKAWRGAKVPFLYTFESLTKSLPSEKGHGKDSVRNILSLEDKPKI